jgi:hypothetical protein
VTAGAVVGVVVAVVVVVVAVVPFAVEAGAAAVVVELLAGVVVVDEELALTVLVVEPVEAAVAGAAGEESPLRGQPACLNALSHSVLYNRELAVNRNDKNKGSRRVKRCILFRVVLRLQVIRLLRCLQSEWSDLFTLLQQLSAETIARLGEPNKQTTTALHLKSFRCACCSSWHSPKFMIAPNG